MTTTNPSPTATPAPPLRPSSRPPPPSSLPPSIESDSPSTAPTTAPGPNRHRQGPITSDPLSDRATSALIRRTLCSQQQLGGDKGRDAQRPIEELLPPLTSRNDVDLQLYALLAIILREFVQSWYGKITSDETFVAEILHIIAHCSRGLEQRFRKVDLESLLLDEVPDLLDKHITAYRMAHQPVTQSPIQVEPRQVYHALLPLPSLSPVPQVDDEATFAAQRANESAYRQLLVQAVLAVLLPTEDLENPCLTAIVEQIFSELIIGNLVANKVAQPWLIWEGICILANVQRQRRAKAATETMAASGKTPRRWNVHGFFLSVINLVMLFVTATRFLASAVVASSSLPPRDVYDVPLPVADGSEAARYDVQKKRDLHEALQKAPILSFSIWTCAGNLIELPQRMPWLSGILSLVLHGSIKGPGKIGRFNGTVDRFLSHCIRSLISPSHLPQFLRTIRGVLFPGNAPGKSTLSPPSSEEELLALRRRAASALWGLIPTTVGKLYLGGRLWRRGGTSDVVDASADDDDAATTAEKQGVARKDGDDDDDDEEETKMIDEVESILMVFSDEYCNKHLVYSILELVLVRLMPELRDKGVEELWDERLG